MKKILPFLFIIVACKAFSQEQKVIETEIAVNSLIKGTLYSPEKTDKDTKLVITIAGSGMTNRSGNQFGLVTNSTKYLALALAKNGIAVYSYDKRAFAQMIAGNVDETKMSFDDGIGDATDVVAFFRALNKYSKIIIAGHSEGSMVGMVAANGNADAFISIAGPGRPIDQILAVQIAQNMPAFKAEADGYLAKMKSGEPFSVKSAPLESIFRESVRPYMLSWMKYNPQDEIKKLKIPVLLINGTKDSQVAVSEAELLKAAKPDAELHIIPNMNHVLKEIKGGDSENAASYNKPELPIMPEFVSIVNQFIKTI